MRTHARRSPRAMRRAFCSFSAASCRVGRSSALTGPDPGSPGYHIDAMQEMSRLHVITETPFNAETAPSDLTRPVTPLDAFFVRNHFAPPPPGPDWRLEVNGQRFCLADLQVLGSETRAATLECAGNGRALMEPRPPGTPWGTGAVATALWTGIPLARLMAKAAPPPDSVELVFEGADGDGTTVYARSLPIQEALGKHVWLVWGMNGESLPVAHGGPLRLIVAGWQWPGRRTAVPHVKHRRPSAGRE